MSRFIQIVSAAVPASEGYHQRALYLYALDEDGRVWAYDDDRYERSADGSLKYDEHARPTRLPPCWVPLTDDRLLP
jgi:hypothetical protein